MAMAQNASEGSSDGRESYHEDDSGQDSNLLKTTLEGSYTAGQGLSSTLRLLFSRGHMDDPLHRVDTLENTTNETLLNVSSGPCNETEDRVRGVAGEMPLEMMFNTSHIITISAYSCLMVLSALGNISVLRSIAG